jgi:catechol 2,3-dioxygenase-like lactoylglutathione lyase family enzyme
VAGERAFPILPCADLDEALEFYRALGFRVTYEQRRPNPHAVVELGDLGIHLSGIEGFDPAASYASVIVTVPDADLVHDGFRAGLRERYGAVPIRGIPRMLRPRRKAGTATGFSVVDPGGNWLRFYRAGETEETAEERRTGLARVVDTAARQSDSRGEEGVAIAMLEAGLARHVDASGAERFEALLLLAELRVRTGDDPSDAIAAAVEAASSGLGPQADRALAELREAAGIRAHPSAAD